MKVYLDDIRDAYVGWVRTYTVDETIELIKTGQVTHLSLDHDLTIQQTLGYDDKEKTGYDVVLWMEEYLVSGGDPSIIPKSIALHTANPAGRQRMQRGLDSINKLINRLT